MIDFSGKSTGRYIIKDKLGMGGMAVVYRAYDTTLDLEVAIKFIRMERLAPEFAEKARQRFKIEALKTAKLVHPNIIPVTDYGEFEGVPYLVMRYIDGGRTLKSVMGKPFVYPDAEKIIIPIAQALGVAHAHHIVHRDVKPSNILLTPEGIPLLTDFGIAKVLDQEYFHDGLTSTGVAIGTPEYMAPEQWEGQPVDERADIYALGVVYYELVTGRPPFKADTVPATMVQVLRDPLPRPSTFVKEIPATVEGILYAALARDPANRYKSMGGLVAAIERKQDVPPPMVQNPMSQIDNFSQSDSVITRDTHATQVETNATRISVPEIPASNRQMYPPYGGYPNRSNKRTKIWIPMILSITAVAAVGIVAVMVLKGTGKESTLSQESVDLTQAGFTESAIIAEKTDNGSRQKTNTPDSLILATDIVATKAVSPWKQGKIAYMVVQNNTSAIMVRDLVTDQAFQVYSLPGLNAFQALAFSPDGTKLVYNSNYPDEEMSIIDATKGSNPTFLKICQSPTFSGDGNKILCVSPNSGLILVDAVSGAVVQKISQSSWPGLADLSAATGEIAYTVNSGGTTQIWRTSLNGESGVLLASGGTENYVPDWSPDGRYIAYQSNEASTNSEIWIMDRDGNNKRQITHTPNNGWSRSPSWSPDGKYLAYISNQNGSMGADLGDVFIVNVATGDTSQFTNSGGYVYDWRVSWGG